MKDRSDSPNRGNRQWQEDEGDEPELAEAGGSWWELARAGKPEREDGTVGETGERLDRIGQDRIGRPTRGTTGDG